MRFLVVLILFSFCCQFSFSSSTENEKLFNMFFHSALKARLSGDKQNAFDLYMSCLRLDNKSAVVCYELARLLYKNKDYKTANQFIDMAIKNDTTNNKYYLQFAAELKVSTNQISSVAPIYERLIQIEPTNYDNYIILSKIYTDISKYEDALTVLDKVPASELSYSEYVMVERSEIYLKMGKHKLALKVLQELYNKDNSVPRYHYLLSQYYLTRGDTVNGLAYCRSAASLPGGDVHNFSLANIYVSQHKLDLFYKHAQQAINSPEVSEETKYDVLLSYIINYEAQIMTEDFSNFIISSLNSCIDQYPENQAFYTLLSKYLVSHNRNDDAIQCYEDLLSLHATIPADEWRDFLVLLLPSEDYPTIVKYTTMAVEQCHDEPILLLMHGQVLQSLSRYSESLQPLRHCYSLLGKIPDSQSRNLKVSVLNCLAITYYYLDSINTSFYYYEEVLKLDQYNLLALNNYSYYLSLIDKDLEKAEQMSRVTINIEPSNPTYLDTYAWILFKLKRYTEAMFIIERALDNGGADSAEVLEHYADILFMSDMPDKALEFWKKAYELDSSNEKLKSKIDAEKYIP